MEALVQRFMPELFITEFDRMKSLAGDLAAHLIIRLSRNPLLAKLDEASCKALNDFVAEYPFIQFACLTDATGKMVCSAIAD